MHQQACLCQNIDPWPQTEWRVELTEDVLCSCSGVQDLFDMLQSPTFVLQLGYGILEICCVNLFPEMKALFRQMEHGVN
jgi:hypothetical protein